MTVHAFHVPDDGGEPVEVSLETGEVLRPAPEYVVPEGIPAFEGKPVHFTAAKLTSVARLEIGDEVFGVDDMVRLVVECRVSGIDHKVNETTGELGRFHMLKAVDCQVVPWSES